MCMKNYFGILLLIISLSCDNDDKSLGSWRRLDDFPEENRNYGVSFALKGKGYWAFGQNNFSKLAEVWAYDPRSSWTKMKDFPYEADAVGIIALTATVVNDRAYVYTTSNRVYEYNPDKDEWTHVSTSPFHPSDGLVSFAIGDNAYFGLGKFWQYNTKQKSWTEVEESLPGPRNRVNALSFVIGNNAYVGGGYVIGTGMPPCLTDLYRFDEQSKKWQAVADIPENTVPGPTFGTTSRGYVGLMKKNNAVDTQMFEYNPESDRWRKLHNFPSVQSLLTTSFVINNHAFVIGGTFSDSAHEVWEFVP